MEWSKAKSYLIFLFLILNIFLIGSFIQMKYDSHIPTRVLSDTEVILAAEGIQLDCDIPQDAGDGPLLNCQPGNTDPQQVVKTLLGKQFSDEAIPRDGSELASGTKRIAFYGAGHFLYQDTAEFTGQSKLDQDAALERVEAFMKTLGLETSRYHTDSINEDGRGGFMVALVEKYKKSPMFDSYITAVVEKGGIRSFEYSSIQFKGISEGTVQIMPAYQVLVKNLVQVQQEKPVITRIELGFKGMKQQQQDLEFSIGPAWRISFRDGSVRYFRAIDGQELK